MTHDDIAALRQALAAGPASGPVGPVAGPWDRDGRTMDVRNDIGDYVCSVSLDDEDLQVLATLSYIAAASPDRIARLLDALEAAQRHQEPAAWGVYVGDELMRPFGNLEQATEWAIMEKARGSGYTYHIRELYAARCFDAAMKDQA